MIGIEDLTLRLEEQAQVVLKLKDTNGRLEN